jgi:hypothetical protein
MVGAIRAILDPISRTALTAYVQVPSNPTYQRKDYGSILNKIICDDAVAAICCLNHTVLQVRE